LIVAHAVLVVFSCFYFCSVHGQQLSRWRSQGWRNWEGHIGLGSPLLSRVLIFYLICRRSISFVHIVFVYLLVNEFCARLRTASYIYELKSV